MTENTDRLALQPQDAKTPDQVIEFWYEKWEAAYDEQSKLLNALNGAYTERTNLVALLAQIYPSGWDYADPTTPEWPVVFVDLPTGQATWHIHPEDWWICACIPRRHGAQWDGHTTPEKYQRIRDLIAEIEKNHPEHTSHIEPTQEAGR